MRLAAIERQVAQDQRIRDIDQQIRDLYQQRQTLLQKVLQDNQEYQAQVAESQTIMQSFRTSFQRPDTISTGQRFYLHLFLFFSRQLPQILRAGEGEIVQGVLQTVSLQPDHSGETDQVKGIDNIY